MSVSSPCSVSPNCSTWARSSVWWRDVWRSFLMTSMISLALASPFILRSPLENSLIVRTPSPSSKMVHTSFMSVTLRSNRSSICLTFLLWRASKNSSIESSPEPSLSISRNRSARAFSSCFFCSSMSLAFCDESSLATFIAFSTMMAVIRFQNTKTPTKINSTKKTLRPNCFSMTGLAMSKAHVSRVINWNMVNIDRNGLPKSSCM
mmetsp:Transcript_89100/g.229944  ORF Transcript_89100/g.229944 Transcript_89100/m.229944 type:complete len:206 (+) Transcript_89100:465-1082(+)